MPTHRSLNLTLGAFTSREDSLHPSPLLLRREVDKWPQPAFGHEGRGQRIAESGNGLQDFLGEAEDPQHLGYTGIGNPQLAGQVSGAGAVPVF